MTAPAPSSRGAPAAWAFACGKVILAGEHASVYGHPAVAVGLDRGVRARALPVDEAESVLRIGAVTVAASEPDDLARAFRVVLGSRPGPVMVDVETELPPGSGLGSSAAIGVAVIRALAPHAGEAEVLRAAMGWERVFHGSPSGLDALIAARGGCTLFRRGAPPIALPIARAAVLCVGHSGTTAGTRAMVAAVAGRRTRAGAATDLTLRRIGDLAAALARALVEGDVVAVGALMTANHALLRELGVSTPTLDRMGDLAREAGALGAKVTGAGGGGCMVALCDRAGPAGAVLAAWERAGLAGFAAPLGMP